MPQFAIPNAARPVDDYLAQLSTDDRCRLEEIFLGASPDNDSIVDSIKRSSSILGLERGWDDGDAPPIEIGTWLRAANFLINYSRWAKAHEVSIPAPKIFPSIEGGIDIAWRKPTYRLLIHIPSKTTIPADFTGTLPDGREFEEEPISTAKFEDAEHYRILEFLKNG
jgi:hypothetical protein